MGRPFALMTAAAVTAGGLTLMPPASPATIEAAGLPAAQPSNIQRTEVCFTVKNIGDPDPQQVSGTLFHNQNYTGGGTALLLQHGGASDRSVWDGGRPGITGVVSMVDLLVGAGYVVFAVDRLGFARSPYTTGSGWTLTIQSYVEMTHEMVTQIRSGTYRITTDTCADAATAGRPASKVVLMGHSSGGVIIEFYATRYHDIDGIVPMMWGNSGQGNKWSEEQRNTVAPQWAEGKDYVYLFEADANGYSQPCEDFLFYAVGVSEDVVKQVCGPEGFGGKPTSPSGEFTAATAVAEIVGAIGNVGPTPALLVFGDQDLLFPNAQPGDDEPDSDTITPEMETWTTWMINGCNCDVEFLWQRNSGHAGPFHDSAAELTADVIEWLRSRGL